MEAKEKRPCPKCKGEGVLRPVVMSNPEVRGYRPCHVCRGTRVKPDRLLSDAEKEVRRIILPLSPYKERRERAIALIMQVVTKDHDTATASYGDKENYQVLNIKEEDNG